MKREDNFIFSIFGLERAVEEENGFLDKESVTSLQISRLSDRRFASG